MKTVREIRTKAACSWLSISVTICSATPNPMATPIKRLNPTKVVRPTSLGVMTMVWTTSLVTSWIWWVTNPNNHKNQHPLALSNKHSPNKPPTPSTSLRSLSSLSSNNKPKMRLISWSRIRISRIVNKNSKITPLAFLRPVAVVNSNNKEAWTCLVWDNPSSNNPSSNSPNTRRNKIVSGLYNHLINNKKASKTISRVVSIFWINNNRTSHNSRTLRTPTAASTFQITNRIKINKTSRATVASTS